MLVKLIIDFKKVTSKDISDANFIYRNENVLVGFDELVNFITEEHWNGIYNNRFPRTWRLHQKLLENLNADDEHYKIIVRDNKDSIIETNMPALCRLDYISGGVYGFGHNNNIAVAYVKENIDPQMMITFCFESRYHHEAWWFADIY